MASDGVKVGLLVGAITAIGFALRMASFGDALFGDELSTYLVVAGNDPGRVLDLVNGPQEITPPLYFLLAWLTQNLGDSADWLRLPSLIAGVAAIPLTYLLGLWTVGRRAGLVGSALVALSPFLIFYSDEARPYALLMLFVLASTVALVRALDTGARGWWLLYGVASCAAAYTHYTTFFVLAAQLVWALVVHPEARRWLLGVNVVAALAYLPWIPGVLDDQESPGRLLIALSHPFGLDSLRDDVGVWLVGYPFAPIQSLPGAPGLALIAGGIAIAVVGLVLRRRGEARERRWRPSARTTLVILIALATPVAAAIISAIGDSVFIPRNLIASSPGIALAVAALLTSAAGAWRIAAITLVIGGFAIGAAMMLDPDDQRSDYEAAARFINEVGAPGDPVVDAPFRAPAARQALEVALAPVPESPPEEHPVLRLGTASLEDELRIRAPDGPGQFARPPIPPPEQIAREAAALAAEGGRLFLVTPGGVGEDGVVVVGGLQEQVDRFLAALPPTFTAVETRTFPGLAGLGVGVTVYEPPAAADAP